MDGMPPLHMLQNECLTVVQQTVYFMFKERLEWLAKDSQIVLLFHKQILKTILETILKINAVVTQCNDFRVSCFRMCFFWFYFIFCFLKPLSFFHSQKIFPLPVENKKAFLNFSYLDKLKLNKNKIFRDKGKISGLLCHGGVLLEQIIHNICIPLGPLVLVNVSKIL